MISAFKIYVDMPWQQNMLPPKGPRAENRGKCIGWNVI